MEEELETQEIKEAMDEHVEHHEHAHHGEGDKDDKDGKGAGKDPGKGKAGGHGGGSPKWTTYLSVSTALIAVFAAISALLSGSNSNEAILKKSDAMLASSQSADQWALFQAKSMKLAVDQSEVDLITDMKLDDAKRLDELGKHQAGTAKDKNDAQAQAKALDEKVVEDNESSEMYMERHHKFAITVTLLQIAIALSAIAALTKKKPMWFVGLAASAAGLVMFTWGLIS